MSKTKYCNDCERNVTPRRTFKLGHFILSGFMFYPLVYWLQKKKCPICNGTNFKTNV